MEIAILITSGITAVTAVIVAAMMTINSRHKARERFKDFLECWSGIPAVFDCGAQLIRILDRSEAFPIADDGNGTYTLAEGEYFLRCKMACAHQKTCARFNALANRLGKLTPIRLSGAAVNHAYGIDRDGRIAVICDPHPEYRAALIRGVAVETDLGGAEMVSHAPVNGSGDIDDLDKIIE